MGVVQDEVFRVEELAVEPQRRGRVGEVGALQKTVAQRTLLRALVEAGQKVFGWRFYFPISNARTSYEGDRIVLSLLRCRTDRVHSHYMRRVADLQWQGQVVEIRLHARRFRCADPQCRQRIFTEQLPETVQPKARRTARLRESQLVIGLRSAVNPARACRANWPCR
ncbi:hypothetical protein NKI89_29185 [Mesorhizobium sp. M0309]|uniref:transposase family protein n=1 Tax=Mesorhizobium sp. M0309 TaxID=2956933 RepID=UPI003334E2F1